MDFFLNFFGKLLWSLYIAVVLFLLLLLLFRFYVSLWTAGEDCDVQLKAP